MERYLWDLRATLSTNVDDARQMLSLAVDTTVLRREEKHLVARITGNLAGMFVIDGAGRGISHLDNLPSADFVA